MRVLRLVLLFLLLAAPVAADVWQAARDPGAVLIMRHAIAPGVGDPPEFRLDDCATQRNLDQRGRLQARAIGRMLAVRGLQPDRILTSQWCRARDTAQFLGLGEPEAFPVLNSFFGDFPNEPAQTAALRRFLAEGDLRARLLLVTHQVNITALTGLVPRAGEIVVLSRDGFGRIAVAGRIPPP
ncbi:MAG: histidine phosphatase family protein [Paracoccaceae bacterium]|nr:MAG: histidine phosphatase family protein [Paracoccaceae bacterium]